MPNRSLLNPWVQVCVYLFLFLICGNNAWSQTVVGYSLEDPPSLGHYHAFLWDNRVMQDLGTLPGHTDSLAQGINNACQVTGSSWVQESHAFLWSNGLMQDLGIGTARGINNAGQVVGGSGGHAFLWSNGVTQDLGALPGGNYSDAYGINDAGQVVGFSNVGGVKRPFLWSNGVMQDLGTLPGQPSGVAYGINNAGQVVGVSSGGGDHAVLWSNGGIKDLGTLPGGQFSVAGGINNAGQVVGGADTFGGQTHAVLWSAGGGIQDLGTLPGGNASGALGITDAGQVAGDSNTFESHDASRNHAVLWSNSVMQDLGVLPGTVRSEASGITGFSCGSFPNFALSASPASQSVVQGGSTSYTVTITPSGGFSDQVDLDVSFLPASASFDPNPATATSTLSVTTSADTPPGTYGLMIFGTTGSTSHFTTVSLVVSTAP